MNHGRAPKRSGRKTVTTVSAATTSTVSKRRRFHTRTKSPVSPTSTPLLSRPDAPIVQTTTRRKLSQQSNNSPPSSSQIDPPTSPDYDPRVEAFTRREAPQGYVQPTELGPEYLDEPDETPNQGLLGNLKTLLHQNYNFGFKSYSEVINTATPTSSKMKFSAPGVVDTEALEQQIQRQQTMEDAIARRSMQRMYLDSERDFLQRQSEEKAEAQRQLDAMRIAADPSLNQNHQNTTQSTSPLPNGDESALEANILKQIDEEMNSMDQKRAGLRPIRNRMPPEIRHLSSLLVNEARSRGLNERGDRDPTIDNIEPVIDDDGKVHSSDAEISIDGKQYRLAEMPDKLIVSEIIRISMDWNRSGTRNKPLAAPDLTYSNKAKLETGVSPFFSADRERGGREFTYGRFIDSIEKAVKEGEGENKAKDSKDGFFSHSSTTAPISSPHISTHSTPTNSQSSRPIGFPKQLMSLDHEEVPRFEDRYETSVHEAEQAPPDFPTHSSLPHGITLPTNLNLLKGESPFNKLEVKKSQTAVNDKIAGNAKEMAQQLIHRDFLHNSIIRRKPRGKLTELELRDVLVDVERAHPLPKIFEHYDISMLSLFEEAGNAQPISVAADVIGGFTPVYLKVKTDFDPTFVKMIKVLHQQQQFADEATQDVPETTFAGISSGFEDSATKAKKAAEKKSRRNEAEKKHLEFLNRLISTDNNGYSVLHKDDVLIPDFPDSVIEIILAETLDKQVGNEDDERMRNAQHGGKSKNKNDQNDQNDGVRLDHSMRDSMMREMLLFKGKTIGQLHQMGCFNRNPYDDVAENEYTPGGDRHDDEGGQRNRYAFTDDMKHMHRWSSVDDAQMHDAAIYGGKRGADSKGQYVERLKKRDERFHEKAKKHSSMPLMTETGGFISAIDPEDVKNYKPFYAPKGRKGGQSAEGGEGGDRDGEEGEDEGEDEGEGMITQTPSLHEISRFAQLAVASSVISKYGAMDASYREATGVNMSKIDDLIVEALHEGDVPIKKMPPAQRQKYLSELKTEALEFPKRSFEAMSQSTHVPYMVTGLFHKIPSKFLGMWDFELASNAFQMEKIGIHARELERIGPYHPMFLVTVGGRGFTQENQWDISELRMMLRGDIDERPEVMARRTARWMEQNPGLDPEIYQPYKMRTQWFTETPEAVLEQKYDPLAHFGDVLGENQEELMKIEEQARVQKSHQQNQKALLHDYEQRSPMPMGGNAYFDEMNRKVGASRAKLVEDEAKSKKQAIDSIPEIVDDDDEAELDQHFSKSQSQRQEERDQVRAQLKREGEGGQDLGKAKPILPQNYPQLKDIAESNDPNEITFNTGNMTEFHKTHEVNEYDIKETSEALLSTAEFTHKVAKEKEREALENTASPDVSHKLRLRYFVDTEYQASKNEKLAKEIDGDYTGEVRKPKEAMIVTSGGQSQKYGPDIPTPDRMKPNPFDKATPERLQINLDNPQHELYGGPITVQHFLSGMIGTEEGQKIAKGIEKEHREFLGDDVYDQAILNSPVNKKPLTWAPTPITPPPVSNEDWAAAKVTKM